MDLLGAYGSDSDSDESNNSGHHTKEKENSNQKIVGGEKFQSNGDNKVENNKGRRLLQLNAILPPAIFERLTRPEEESDSDIDQDDENSTKVMKKKNVSTGGNNNNYFSSLLEDLRATETTSKLTSSINDTNTSSSHVRPKEEEKMGMAFTLSHTTTTTTTTTTKARNNESNFIDIHSVPEIETTASNKVNDIQNMHRKQYQRVEKSSSVISAAPPININRRFHNQSPSLISNGSSNTNIPKQRQPTMSKREMEKALRAGQFQVLNQSASNIVELRGEPSAPIGNSITSKEEWEQIKMTHGKANLRGLSSYDPKAGSDTATQDLSQKHRSKHQIHQLMASAARLEAQRSTASSNSNNALGKTHRANAKRKYGW